MIWKRRLLLLLVLASPATTARGDELTSKVDALFARWDKPGSPGAVLAVVKGGKILYTRGYGMADLEHDAPITPRTVFHVASVSKQFTAFGIVLLAEQGRLGLDDDIGLHLREVPDFGRRITIRQLIHHTSGLRDQWDLLQMAGWRMDDVLTQAQILRLVARQRELNFVPGSAHVYCNTGYTLLAEIVARVGGKPFPEWMQVHVFKPLGMDRTLFYDDHERIVKDRAYSYQRADRGEFKKSVLNYANVGATSLFTTADDLARWVANLGAPRVGDEGTIARMCARGKLSSDEQLDYACGLVVDEYRGLRRIGHSGGDAGYRSYVGWFPDQNLGVIVLSNLASFNPMGRAMDVARLYVGDQMKEPRQDQATPAANEPNAVAIAPAKLDDFAGRYEVADSGVIVAIRRVGERFFSSAAGGNRVELFPLSESSFFAREMALRIEFHRGETGRVTHLTYRLGDSAPPEGVVARRLEPFEPTAVDLAAYAGEYVSPELETSYRLVVKGETLVAEHSRHEDTPLRPVRKDRFANSLLGRVQFERDPDGRINGLRATTGRVRNLRFDRRD